MCEYLTNAEYKELQEVPDPYFGGQEGFEKASYSASCSCASVQDYSVPVPEVHAPAQVSAHALMDIMQRLSLCVIPYCTMQVLDLLEDACEGLLSSIESSKFATES